MATEIERKFLVEDPDWRKGMHIESSSHIDQGYLCAGESLSVRVRLRGGSATLTIKGPTEGIARKEYEYPLPVEDAQGILDLCGERRVTKRRHIVKVNGLAWEIDEFSGRNEGLVVAELELSDEQQEFDRPPWLGREVSDQPKYFNANLALKPFSEWDQ